MGNSKNLLMAVLCSALVWVSWQYFIEGPKHRQLQEQAAVEKNKSGEVIANENSPGGAGKEIVKERAEAIEESPRIPIISDKLHGSLSLKGARFDDITLAKYKQTIDPGSPEVVLLSPSDTDSFYFGEFGWIGKNGGKVPDSSSLWKADGKTIEPGKPLTLTWQNDRGVIFKQTITLDENYMFKVVQSIENKGGAVLEAMPYGLLNRTNEKDWQHVIRGRSGSADTQHKTYFILHEGVIGALNGQLEEIRYKKLAEDKEIEYKSNTGWLGITDKYWLTAMIPSGQIFDAHLTYSDQDNIPRFQVDYLGADIKINPGESKNSTTYFFAGAKEVRLLDDYSKNLNIPLFDRAIDFGWFYFITKRMFYLLSFIHSHVGNFGVAIILLTMLVKMLMFPLANKSYKSMSQMKALQPEIAKLRERYGSDKMKLNQEVMQLYKKEKVNPLSGCLPLFIQIPVFFSLYKVLFVTIEMRHAPFIWWIHDLSAPDPTSVFNLFGLIPWTPPAFLMIGVLPLLMGITMFLQQRLNPAPADPVQAQMMRALPFIFVFLFSSFPAGLVLYWVSSNSLSILQQWVITREVRRGKKK